MINFILTAVGFLIIGLLFSWLRGKIVKKFFKTSKKIITNARIGKQFKLSDDNIPIEKITSKEYFSWFKFKKIFNLGSGVEWIKSVKEIMDLRKFVIYATIIGIMFAYGWWQGKGEKPVELDIGRYQEVVIRLNGNQLHVYKNGEVWVEKYKTGKKIKRVKVKDIPFLKDKLKPLKLKLRPILVAGGSAGDKGGIGGEVGVGVSVIEMWKTSLDAFITTHPAIYGGVSYAVTNNAGIGIGYGKGLRNFDDRVIIYARIRF